MIDAKLSECCVDLDLDLVFDKDVLAKVQSASEVCGIALEDYILMAAIEKAESVLSSSS